MARKIVLLILTTTAALAVVYFCCLNNHFEISVSDKIVSLSAANQIKNQIRQMTEESADIGNQKPLENPPETIKAIYLTSWSAGNNKKINYLLDLKEKTGINAVVIDIKDYSGYVAFDSKIPEVKKYQAERITIPQLNRLIKQLHDNKIYVIARLSIFQDPRLALARPDLTVKNKKNNLPWEDRKGLSWIDPASREAWNYIITIAKETANRGFDELNFDYIRFPSDGDLGNMDFPFWQKIRTDPDSTLTEAETKRETIKNFFKYLRQELPNVKISADLFGLATVNQNDLGIGQIIEDSFEYFDFICPMVYPSHYASGFLGYKNPANYPYEIVKYSINSALKRLKNYESIHNEQSSSTRQTTIINNATSTKNPMFDNTHKPKPKLRPWLQDFDLGAIYDADMVRKQIKGIYDAMEEHSASSTLSILEYQSLIHGWMLWSPSNVYSL